MASLLRICTCIFIFALISAPVIIIPCAEGRPLKALKKEEFNSFAADETGLSNHAKKTTQEKNIPAEREGEFDVAPPSSTSKNPDQFGTMLSFSTTFFKPTAPGNSPRVGPSVVESEQDDQQKPPGSHFVRLLSLSPADLKPTNPGRSPSVGHFPSKP